MIKLQNITKIYNQNLHNQIVALEDINLTFKQGCTTILKGVSGSGKSTILSLIASLNKPTSGSIVVNNKQISKLPDKFASIYRRDMVGLIFQKYNLIDNLTVQQNISLPLVPQNPDQAILQQKVNQVMEKFHIQHKQNTKVKHLSGGEQQRVAIARANINDPQIILADEPTANLDKKLSLSFIQIIKELKSQNKTIIIATHDPLFFDLDFVDQVVELENGKVIKCY